ncbi:hypothetical protein C8Q76DRAFT_783496 [Earliella scabrosa]|nr:hypothetical protein C8Q76DRAFT_783496 [Earliella scabrosa]
MLTAIRKAISRSFVDHSPWRSKNAPIVHPIPSMEDSRGVARRHRFRFHTKVKLSRSDFRRQAKKKRMDGRHASNAPVLMDVDRESPQPQTGDTDLPSCISVDISFDDDVSLTDIEDELHEKLFTSVSEAVVRLSESLSVDPHPLSEQPQPQTTTSLPQPTDGPQPPQATTALTDSPSEASPTSVSAAPTAASATPVTEGSNRLHNSASLSTISKPSTDRAYRPESLVFPPRFHKTAFRQEGATPRTPGDTRWHYDKSPDYIATPSGLSLSETLQPGDLFLHEHTVTGLVRAWVWMSEGVWTPALEGLEHPTIQERRLWFNDGRYDWGKVTPSWVTEHTVTTYRSRLRRVDKAKENCPFAVVGVATLPLP